MIRRRESSRPGNECAPNFYVRETGLQHYLKCGVRGTVATVIVYESLIKLSVSFPNTYSIVPSNISSFSASNFRPSWLMCVRVISLSHLGLGQ